ncbi:MAG: ABC transporter permease [Tistrella sp.]|jgi:simple sugar transport system permease protein|uniref:ABC transporter permease n=1 Tax=Tistrella mobilis TaxID=171437 RepID=A0A162JUE2_9PROT|nr:MULTISPECIES: ABC transporter permease [Tistrella]KYO49900.1 ABC transporter permease [Tistrella mobilis]MAD35172.1 ABC transporter permease [Tistrella sp.]MBA76969.1 ABC transporter permease [Tistrella sp.]HAE47757.1 ABC transporter permease [Tistrella mobilis]
MRLERRAETPAVLSVAVPVLALLAAFVIGALLIVISGASVPAAYAAMVEGAFGSRFALTETLTRAAPLMLTGLAAAVAFRARLWNIGAEGQLYGGALAAVWIGTAPLGIPDALLLPAVILAGAVAGGLLLLGPAVLKTRFGVDEVVTTLLLNFIVLLFVSMMIEGPMKDPMAMGWPQSETLPMAAELPRLIPRTRLHAGLIMALVAAGLIYVMMTRTVLGFEMRAVGASPRAARFAGMGVGRVMLLVALISGGLAGLAGVSEVAGRTGYLTLDMSPGYGTGGVVVAMLAQLHPLGVVLGALMVASIFVGADAMSRAVGVPTYIADVLVAVSLLCMLTAMLFARYRLRRG